MGRKKGSTRILTDTPEKAELEKAIQARSSSSKRKLSLNMKGKKVAEKPISKKKKLPRKNSTEKRKTSVVDVSEEHCCICKAIYGSEDDVKQKEEWFQCRWCSLWAHESCGNVDPRWPAARACPARAR